MSQSTILFDDLLCRYEAGERDFSGVVIKNSWREKLFRDEKCFKGLDLSEIILRDSNISSIGPYMQGVILHKADLTRVDLGECNFEWTNLSRAKLRETGYFQSCFDRVNLSRTDLTGAELIESSFAGADLSQSKLRNATIAEIHFIGNNLTGAMFKKAQLGSVYFIKANLTKTNFEGAVFGKGVEFRDCHFEETIMPDGSIRNAS